MPLTAWMRTRRDHQRFLALIALLTLVHQYQRPQHPLPLGDVYLEATPADYRQAYALAQGVLRTSLSPLQKDAQEVLEALFRLVGEKA